MAWTLLPARTLAHIKTESGGLVASVPFKTKEEQIAAQTMTAAPELRELLSDALWAMDNMAAILNFHKIESTLDDPRPRMRELLERTKP